jgi:protein TIF31
LLRYLQGAGELSYTLNNFVNDRILGEQGAVVSALSSEWMYFYLQLGDDNERTRESAECVRHLVDQAVKLQKAMNQLKRGEKLNNLPAFQVR